MILLDLIPPDDAQEFKLICMLYLLHHFFTSYAFKISYAGIFCVKSLHKRPGISSWLSHEKGIVSLEKC